MSPSSTARYFSTRRKIGLCAAALVVTLLPTACGTAFAGDRTPEVVEVGGASAAEPSPDEDEAAADDAAAEEGAAEEGADQGAEATETAAPEAPPAEEGAEAQQQRGRGGNDGRFGGRGPGGGRDVGDGKGEEGGQIDAPPGNPDGGAEPPPPANEGGNEGNNGLDVLGTDCTNSQLEPHNGFEVAPACVDTSFGEVAAEENSPSLLITEAPQTVAVGEDFTLAVSTRNLIRDRFLGAAAGGYYLESSFLNEEGLQRGHFHTACRILDSTAEAPDSAPAPEFFVATQDNGGGAAPDTVQIDVPGIDTAGTLQCTSWAGDGSHRTPMMQRANQTPAIDSVRITVQ
jgi:hypothetical protein